MNYKEYAAKFNDLARQKIKATHPIRVFLDISLSNGHAGLAGVAQKEGINVENLDLGEFVIFINKKKTALKMFAPANILVHMKMPGGLNMRAIRFIPRVFNAKEMTIDYKKALTFALNEEFRIRQKA